MVAKCCVEPKKLKFFRPGCVYKWWVLNQNIPCELRTALSNLLLEDSVLLTCEIMVSWFASSHWNQYSNSALVMCPQAPGGLQPHPNGWEWFSWGHWGSPYSKLTPRRGSELPKAASGTKWKNISHQVRSTCKIFGANTGCHWYRVVIWTLNNEKKIFWKYFIPKVPRSWPQAP